MSELIDALDRIVNWLEKHPCEKYSSVDVLQPGLSYEEIKRRVADLPVMISEEVYELYLDSRDYLVLLCKSENVAPISRIYIGGGENEQILFSSLTNMMLTIVECYETGAFYFDDYGYLTNSYYKQESIRQKYNLGTRNFRGGW